MLLLQGEFILLSRIGFPPAADSLSGGKGLLCPVFALAVFVEAGGETGFPLQICFIIQRLDFSRNRFLHLSRCPVCHAAGPVTGSVRSIGITGTLYRRMQAGFSVSRCGRRGTEDQLSGCTSCCSSFQLPAVPSRSRPPPTAHLMNRHLFILLPLCRQLRLPLRKTARRIT